MDKAGSEGKPWISGLYEYRVTPQSGSIASPLQLITQRTPREKAQTKYILGTSYSCESEQFQLILDHAGEQHWSGKSVQENQKYAEDQKYRHPTDKAQLQPIDRE